MPTCSSLWGAATHARSFPGSAVTTGHFPTPPASARVRVREIRDQVRDCVRALIAIEGWDQAPAGS